MDDNIHPPTLHTHLICDSNFPIPFMIEVPLYRWNWWIHQRRWTKCWTLRKGKKQQQSSLADIEISMSISSFVAFLLLQLNINQQQQQCGGNVCHTFTINFFLLLASPPIKWSFQTWNWNFVNVVASAAFPSRVLQWCWWWWRSGLVGGLRRWTYMPRVESLIGTAMRQ